jgi:hypothetical protein
MTERNRSDLGARLDFTAIQGFAEQWRARDQRLGRDLAQQVSWGLDPSTLDADDMACLMVATSRGEQAARIGSFIAADRGLEEERWSAAPRRPPAPAIAPSPWCLSGMTRRWMAAAAILITMATALHLVNRSSNPSQPSAMLADTGAPEGGSGESTFQPERLAAAGFIGIPAADELDPTDDPSPLLSADSPLPPDLAKAIQATVAVRLPEGWVSGTMIDRWRLVTTLADIGIRRDGPLEVRFNATESSGRAAFMQSGKARLAARMQDLGLMVLELDSPASFKVRWNVGEVTIDEEVAAVGIGGIRSGVARRLDDGVAIETDCEISAGFGGGPLVRLHQPDELLGITIRVGSDALPRAVHVPIRMVLDRVGPSER